MIDRPLRFLFIPVSGKFGMGEYARALAIARGVASRWPSAVLHFIVSREAPYAAGIPFAATLLDSSPTFHSGQVIKVIENWQPDVVIFDNAGRTAQLRAAARSGACVVYVSARARQRRKAFRLRWMQLIDEHWIAYPRFIAGEFSLIERLKLRLLRRPAMRYLDVIIDSRAESNAPLLARLGVEPGSYVLVVPGGGTGHPRASTAVDTFLEAAQGLAAAGIATLFVGREAKAQAGVPARLSMLGPLPQADLAALMRGARLIVANGGSTLLQAIACGKPCIAAAIAGDQGERIRRCANAGVAIASRLDSVTMLETARLLLGDEERMNALEGRAIALGLADGVEVAVGAVSGLVAAKQG